MPRVFIELYCISITVREVTDASKCAVHDADADMEGALFSRPIDQDPA
jgi:hypothetical protein